MVSEMRMSQLDLITLRVHTVSAEPLTDGRTDGQTGRTDIGLHRSTNAISFTDADYCRNKSVSNGVNRRGSLRVWGFMGRLPSASAVVSDMEVAAVIV